VSIRFEVVLFALVYVTYSLLQCFVSLSVIRFHQIFITRRLYGGILPQTVMFRGISSCSCSYELRTKRLLVKFLCVLCHICCCCFVTVFMVLYTCTVPFRLSEKVRHFHMFVLEFDYGKLGGKFGTCGGGDTLLQL